MSLVDLTPGNSQKISWKVSWVIVIPHPSLFWYDIGFSDFFFFGKVSVIPKEWWACTCICTCTSVLEDLQNLSPFTNSQKCLLWPMTLTYISFLFKVKVDLYAKNGMLQVNNSCCKWHGVTYIASFSIWPWPLTYDLDLRCHPSLGQGRPPCHKSRLKVKRLKYQSKGATQISSGKLV